MKREKMCQQELLQLHQVNARNSIEITGFRVFKEDQEKLVGMYQHQFKTLRIKLNSVS